MDPKKAQELFGLGSTERPLNEAEAHSGIRGTGAKLDASVSGGWGAHDETDATTTSRGIAALFGLAESKAGGVDGGISGLLELCDVDVRSKSLNPALFESDYLLASRPVLIAGAADEIPARGARTDSGCSTD
jgi:hypothetical protein